MHRWGQDSAVCQVQGGMFAEAVWHSSLEGSCGKTASVLSSLSVPITNAELLTLPCDVLNSSSQPDHLLKTNQIQASIVAEATMDQWRWIAAGSARCDSILWHLTNAEGGLQVTQGSCSLRVRDEEQNNREMQSLMVHAYQLSPQDEGAAGFSPDWPSHVGRSRIAQALTDRGLYPKDLYNEGCRRFDASSSLRYSRHSLFRESASGDRSPSTIKGRIAGEHEMVQECLFWEKLPLTLPHKFLIFAANSWRESQLGHDSIDF